MDCARETRENVPRRIFSFLAYKNETMNVPPEGGRGLEDGYEVIYVYPACNGPGSEEPELGSGAPGGANEGAMPEIGE